MEAVVLLSGWRHIDLGRLKGRRLLLLRMRLLLNGGDHDNFLLRECLLLEPCLALALDVGLGVGDDLLFALEVVALFHGHRGRGRRLVVD